MFKRYAIYMTPPEGPLANLGASWLGWDIAKGHPVPHPDTSLDAAALTSTPRKYGLHGTIKPPFHLARGTTASALMTKARALCAATAPIVLGHLKVAQHAGFVALMPQGDTTALAQLAATTVEQLDPFRAPPTKAELAKRRATPLTPRQEANLTTWGYAYVMDDFRFHITLTNRLPSPLATQAKTVLTDLFAPTLKSPLVIDHLSLVGEAETGQFHLLHRLPLSG